MNNYNFDTTLNQLEHGYERYMNLINSLELLLDEASEILSEDDYENFKMYLKDRIMEDL